MRGRALKILAEKVETREEFTACRSLPFQYFQGYYFARPETLGMKRIDPSMLRVMKLFNRVIGGAEPGLIEAEFRQDVALAYNLLRFINSAGFGLTHKVHDIKHALVVLGHAKLARWLSLLLLSGARAQAASSALFRTALTRARMTELLGRNRLPPGEHDYLFMTGMFSLLEALLERPLPETLASLNLPPAVAEALLGAAAATPYCRSPRARFRTWTGARRPLGQRQPKSTPPNWRRWAGRKDRLTVAAAYFRRRVSSGRSSALVPFLGREQKHTVIAARRAEPDKR